MKHCQGKKQKGSSSFLQNLSGASSLCVVLPELQGRGHSHSLRLRSETQHV